MDSPTASVVPVVPFVASNLELVTLPASLAPPSLAAFHWAGRPCYRLTPAVFARLHQAVESRLARSGPDATTLESARALIVALDRVYDALAAVCSATEIHATAPGVPLPPLPSLPAIPGDDGTAACDLDRGVVSGPYAAWCLRGGGLNPMRPPEPTQRTTTAGPQTGPDDETLVSAPAPGKRKTSTAKKATKPNSQPGLF